MTPARTETALMVLVNGGAVALLAWLALRGDLAVLLADPAHILPAVGLVAALAIAWSWIRYAQALRAAPSRAARLVEGVEWVANLLPVAGLAGCILGMREALATHPAGPEATAAATTAMLSTVIGLAGMWLVGLSARLASSARDKADAR